MDLPSWSRGVKLVDKKGNRVPLREALDKIDELDLTKPAYLGRVDAVPHDVLLLALSADYYPVHLEKTARKIRVMLGR